MEKIKNTDKICFNCKYFAWLVGIGQGIRCFHETKKIKGKISPTVPSRYHTCELFEFKIKINSK